MTVPTFKFGENWQAFNRNYLNQERVDLTKKSLTSFLGVSDFAGKSFIDVGAGSGIVSLASLQLGANEVVSFDVDPDCISCCEALKKESGDPPHWKVMKGSILDDAFARSMGQFDIVYSWGVLHHTGKMWQAIANAATLVKSGGAFFFAIYNKADGFCIYPDGRFGPSSFWLLEKKIYVSLPFILQRLVDYFVMGTLIVLYTLTLRNPMSVIRSHKNYFNKGMSWSINIRDWLGGYPYECATVAEIFAFMKERGFVLENMTCNNGLLNNEFLFRKI
ncbi:MAG: class I SAM-dependent methyltransferase [Candidatus Peribacteraceae bacterium]